MIGTICIVLLVLMLKPFFEVVGQMLKLLAPELLRLIFAGVIILIWLGLWLGGLYLLVQWLVSLRG